MLRKVSFLITFFIVFLASYAFLAWVDFLPEPVSPKTSEKKAVLETENDLNKPVIEAENEVKTSFVGNILPEKITFDSLDRRAHCAAAVRYHHLQRRLLTGAPLRFQHAATDGSLRK